MSERVFHNYIIMQNIKPYVDTFCWMNFLIALYNPFAENWNFCEETQILTLQSDITEHKPATKQSVLISVEKVFFC